MGRKLDLKVGQEVVIKVIAGSNIGRRRNMSLNNIDDWCFNGLVTKIGRKYITVKWSYREEQFNIEDEYRNKYNVGGADYQLYLNKQEVIDEKKADILYTKIKSHFSGWDVNKEFTLDQLERIMNIIDENEE